jgi:hypothetical protein
MGVRLPLLTWTLRGLATVPLVAFPLMTFPLAAQQPNAGTGVASTLSIRTRVEGWNWFGVVAGDDYVYGHLLLRAGLMQQRERFGWRLEFAAPIVVGAPSDATQGHGASYYRANGQRRAVATLFPRQAFVTLGRAADGHRLKLGRFEFSEGGETSPANPTLAAVKRRSVVQRLIGPFNFTQGARSLDGVEYGWSRRGLNVTLLGAVPTVGVFNLDGWNSVPELPVGYAALTGPGPWSRERSEWRVFAAGFADRRALMKADNRALVAREADREPIEIATVGGHLLHVMPTLAGPVDFAAWTAVQFGAWGAQSHRAGAMDLEIGWQPRDVCWRPWLRVGVFASSGDADPSDGRHGTFFQKMATPRLFARFPFYNLMNVRDWQASVTLRPRSRLTLRGDLRVLQLGSVADGWYFGSGPFDTEAFGLGIRPSAGARALGTLADLSADLEVSRHWTLTAYASRAIAGAVIQASTPRATPGRFAFLEVEYRR